MDVMKRCEEAGVIPVVVIEDAKHAVPTAKALLAGGIDVMEITLRTDAGLDSIRFVSESCPNVLVGAGTVISLRQCKMAVTAGAKFIVSPGFDSEVVAWCVKKGIAVLPGCVTPTEIMAGMKLGLNTFKFFPADIYGGMKAMKALSAPFVGIRFIPTGGVNAENLKEYLGMPFVCAIGGSWVCRKADIGSENFDGITEHAKQAREIVVAARG
jgi:2-dehydro-3-deoxyphosphogluconate aldolase/(4S)-4-hydroxy-2-oxoglutarate aldolase